MIAVDVYFIVDIGMNFRTAYFDNRGMIVIDKVRIAKEYLRTWFIIDFVTCVSITCNRAIALLSLEHWKAFGRLF
jgi:hypothetical protein